MKALRPAELREHTFFLLFHTEFYTSEEMEEQIQLYLMNKEPVKKASKENDAAKENIWWRAEDEEFVPLTQADAVKVGDRVRSILAVLPEIDSILTEKMTDWKLSRVSKVDLAILRLAVYELKFDASIHDPIAINEAVELAKRFGGENSSRFVNGVLAKVVAED